jgi:polar amino acid transport system substrate-binding protein
LFATVVFSVIALVAAGCGNGTETSTGTSPTPAPPSGAVSAIAAQVPGSVKADGTLTVAADATYAPNEFIGTDGHTVVGLDADLAKALGQVLGLKVNVINATFATIIPGLASGKYDLGISSFTDTKEREKTVDFVTYFVAGTSFYVKSDGGPDIGSLADLCGRTVAVEQGTTQQADAQAQAEKCKSAGKPGVTVQVFNDQNAVNLALSSGRAQVAMADSPVAAYQVKQSNGTFKVTGSPTAPRRTGSRSPRAPVWPIRYWPPSSTSCPRARTRRSSASGGCRAAPSPIRQSTPRLADRPVDRARLPHRERK